MEDAASILQVGSLSSSVSTHGVGFEGEFTFVYAGGAVCLHEAEHDVAVYHGAESEETHSVAPEPGEGDGEKDCRVH